MTGTRWEDRGCARCVELDHLLDGMQGLCDRLDDEVDTLTIQLHVARQELYAANFEKTRLRERAEGFESRLNALLEDLNS